MFFSSCLRMGKWKLMSVLLMIFQLSKASFSNYDFTLNNVNDLVVYHSLNTVDKSLTLHIVGFSRSDAWFSHNEFLEYLTVSMAGKYGNNESTEFQELCSIKNKVYDNSCSGSFVKIHDWGDDATEFCVTSPIGLSISKGSHEIFVDGYQNSGVLEITIALSSVPELLLYPDYEIKLSGLYDDTQSSDVSFTYYIQKTGWNVSINSFTVQDSSCTTNNLSWELSTDTDVKYSIFSREVGTAVFSNLTSLQSGQSSYTHNFGGNNISGDIEYKLEVGYRDQLYGGDTDYVIGGPPNSKFDPPLTFTAAGHNCDEILLEWTLDQDQSENIDHFIIERNDGESYTVPASETSYNIINNIQDVDYTFTIKSVNECNFLSQPKTAVSTYIDLSAPSSVTATITAQGSLNIEWSNDAEGHTAYIVRKSFNGTSIDISIDSRTTTSYVDENVGICVNYTYEIIPINPCFTNGISGPTVSKVISPDISNTFSNDLPDISKGYFSDRVEISWGSVNQNLIDNYLIFRKILGSTDDSVQIQTLSNASHFIADYTADAGILYQYSLVGVSACIDSVIYTDMAHEIGFRTPTSIVSGQINYDGGVALNGARVLVNSTGTPIGKSILKTVADDYIEIPNQRDISASFMVECWIKPTDLTSGFDLFHKDSDYRIFTDATNLHFYYNGVYNSIPLSHLSENNWQHVAFQLKQDSTQIFINGDFKNSVYTGQWPSSLNVNPIVVAEDFVGNIDELRIWKSYKDNLNIQRDHARFMVGDEQNLNTYLKMDELMGDAVYDISKEGILYNKNHGKLIGSLSRTSDKPTVSQLGNVAYTNELGAYSIVVPYVGVGGNYTVTPSFETHAFSPSTTALFLGDGALVNNNINFTDISSFPVNGYVYYDGTTCPVEEVNILVDNELVVKNGTPIRTDASGYFEINVPIGEHFVSLSKVNHTFSEGRFPQTGLYNFQAPVNGIEFKDNTKVIVIGRIAGGLREANKPLGFNKSKNNIGQAELIFETTTGGGCFIDTVLTDAVSGEYRIELPPLSYIESLKIPSNLAIDFGVLDQLNYTLVPSLKTEYDSIFSVVDNSLISVDSITYHHKLSHTHMVYPEIGVFDESGVDPFIGDTLYVFQGDTINIKQNPLMWPVFANTDLTEYYKALVRVFEKYVNKDSGMDVFDSVPTTSGSLMFKNELATLASVDGSDTIQYPIVKMEDVNSPDSIKTLIYSFLLGEPNFLANTSIPEYSYTKKFEIEYTANDGTIVSWLPVSNPPTGGDQIFRGYALAEVFNGNQFVTNGPEYPDFVLRDPPGSNSSASREIGSTQSSVNSWSSSTGVGISQQVNVFLGVQGDFGAPGATTETEVWANPSFGLETNVTLGRSGTVSTSTTNTKAWSTSGDPGIVGQDGDLFIGKSQNVQFGISEGLTLVPTTADTSYTVLKTGVGHTNNPMSMVKKHSMTVVPVGYNTNFIYSEKHIREVLIPNLENLRNSYLENHSAYTSHLAKTHVNYGKNNDDPAFGISPEVNDPTFFNFADTSGLSYTFVGMSQLLSDTTSELPLLDSVRFFNNQINKWEEALRLNEWEKVNINNQVAIDSVKQYELDKLYDQYKSKIDAYIALQVLNGVSFAATNAVAATPGTAAAGTVVFALTAGTGIASSELYQHYQIYLSKKQRIEERFGSLAVNNITLNGGVEYSASMSHERIAETTTSFEYGVSASIGIDIGAKAANVGAGMELGVSMDYSNSKDWSTETAESETVSYTLSEDDGDYMSVDVHQSILGWGPIFKRKPGGVSSCPYEEAEVTSYYKPGTEISASSQQAHVPVLTVSPGILTNIPLDASAVFNLTPGNNAQDGSDQTYNIRVLTETNPFGAIIKIDGLSPNIPVDIPYQTSINKVLTIDKGPGPVYDYDSIAIVLESPCEREIGDTVYVSAHFLPECTDVELITPENQWVINNTNNNDMSVVISGYNINHFDLERLWVQYKPTNASTWIGLESFWRDTLPANQNLPIPTNTSYTQYNWDVEQLTDGNYDLKIVSECTLSDESSPIYSGVIDRVNPHVFGNPSPSDGVLNAGEDISVKFNEDIESGSLSSLNFDIRGVLNGSEIRHQASLEFDGTSSYMEIPAGLNLQSRDFTIEFWAKTTSTQGTRIFLSQGSGTLEGLKIGIEPTGQVFFEIAGERVKTQGNISYPEQWHHYAFAYNFSNETLEIYVDGNLENNGDISLYSDYTGVGKIYVGKSTYNAPNHFTGNMHDLRVWNHTRSLSEIVIHQSIQVGKQNLGLLHSWEMNEATGNMVTDPVRLRNGILHNTEWALDPGGYAIAFNALNQEKFIAKSGNIAFTDEMDFTIEFWFNGESTNRETLFSNGKGDGVSSDSLTAWSITKYTDGSIHVLHKGYDFEAVPSGAFDGNWHHFALSLNRGSVMTAYLDGNSTGTAPASHFKGFGSDQMVIGSRYFRVGNIKHYDEYYTGSIDEFRIWSLNRSQQQINRDLYFKLLGDELGLISYIPFENYVQQLGIYILNEDYTDQADTSHHVSYVSNTLTSISPKIKLPRPIEKVIFDFSVNGDEIVLTPTTPAERFENVTLDVTVKDVLDLHGNRMQSPKTWIAYPDQNQVVWETDLVSINILKDQAYSFAKKIVNSGGAAKNFTLENIPTWLTASVTEGVVDPGSVFEVTFSVTEDVNIGSYKEDIIVKTDFNYPERLTVDLKVNGIAPLWDVNPEDFEKSMSIIGSISINDVISIDDEDVLYAFINGTCRGKANLQYISSTDKYLLFMDVYSNTSLADTLEFKIWDASTGSIFVDIIPDTLTFISDGLVGSLLSPQPFKAYSKVQETYYLQSGWNWLSFHLSTVDTQNLDLLLSSIQVQDGDQIKTLGTNTVATYSDLFGWIGNLKTTGVQLSKGYKLKLHSSDTLVSLGDVVDPTQYNVDLVEGWNWIGFISIRPMNINVALGNLEATTGDLIKGRSQFSVYDEQLGWIGSLNTLKPGQSYMYSSEANATFTFPYAGAFKQEQYTFKEVHDSRWSVDYTSAPNNMSVVAELEACLENLDFTGWYVGFFDGTGTCRSLSHIQTIQGKHMVFVTATGNDELMLKPKLLSSYTGRELSLDGQLQYKENAHLGNFESPVRMVMNSKDCKLLTPKDDKNADVNLVTMHQEDAFLTQVYPSVFNHEIFVNYNSANQETIHIDLVNSLGQVVYQLEEHVEEGNNTLAITQKLTSLPEGTYLLRLTNTTDVQVFKLLKKN